MVRIVMSLLFVLILSACNTQSPLEKDMRAGKDAFKSEKYEEAIHYFEDALIEKPTDKDAAILLEQAKQKQNEQQTKKAAQNYRNDVQPIYDEFIQIVDKYTEEYLANKNRAIRLDDLNNMEKLKNLQTELGTLNRKYDVLKAINDMNTSLELAIMRFGKMLNKEIVGLSTKHFVKTIVSSFPDDLRNLTSDAKMK